MELQYPLGSYSIDNPPSNETLKSDLSLIQTVVNENIDNIAANTSDIATNAEDIALKADSSTTYTKDEVDSAISSAVSDAVSATKEALYPVGSYYFNGAVSTNPATLLGFGTWTAVAGKALFGLDGTQTEFDTLLKTGGSKTKNLAHTHTVYLGGNARRGTGAANVQDSGITLTTNSGGSSAQDVLNPYEVAAIWRRTA